MLLRTSSSSLHAMLLARGLAQGVEVLRAERSLSCSPEAAIMQCARSIPKRHELTSSKHNASDHK